ncbi:hypothetical protein BGW37DRAFT_476442 [Umbelopsis sp. PMI_123]|nr:hypothetical protein BGW37DRAFT_476442 [Umbelopsis sp. PMI_123]
MPAIAQIVENFQELQAAYEEETGHVLSQEPIHSSQWQLEPDAHLTQKYPYPTKDDNNCAYGANDEPNAIPSTSATIIGNRSLQHNTLMANQMEELFEESSQINDTNLPIEEFTIEDTDATQISGSQIESFSVASSPDLLNQVSSNSQPPRRNHGEELPMFSTIQSSDFSLDTNTEPSPNFWKVAIRPDMTSRIEHYVVLGTHLPHSFSNEFKSIVQGLNGRIVDEFSQEVTHIVTTVDEKKLARRTLKYLQGIMCGKWIIDKAWLEKSKLAGKFIPENEYEVDGDEASDRSSIPRIARQAKISKEPGLFHNLEVAFLGSFHGPSKSDLISLIRYGGGIVWETTDDLPKNVVMIYDIRDNNVPHENCDKVKNAAWILDSISCYRQLPMVNFVNTSP